MLNLKTSDFEFDLPPELIAQEAIEPRDHARLLHATSQNLSDYRVFNLPDILRAGDLLILNDTRVIPARLYGRRHDMRAEILLLKKENDFDWSAFARPGKRLKKGETIVFAEEFSGEIVEKRDDGEILLRFNKSGEAFLSCLNRYGEAPLPPYIRRNGGATAQDNSRYQTVYARRDGAIAAPTAGLHFTDSLFSALRAKDIETAHVTLHVGAGTFLPVKVDHIHDHVMHSEWGEVDPNTAEKINRARHEGRRIVCVGTTSLRVLESAAQPSGEILPFAQETSIFITPGYRFKVVDALITNFHLPRSTLFMLVSAFMGLDRIKNVYAHAIKQSYRFYSYGDTSLLERERNV